MALPTEGSLPWLMADWMKVATADGPVCINPKTVEQIGMRSTGDFWFQFASGEMITGFVSTRLLDDENTVFNALHREKKEPTT